VSTSFITAKVFEEKKNIFFLPRKASQLRRRPTYPNSNISLLIYWLFQYEHELISFSQTFLSNCFVLDSNNDDK
jgi:hypothetical protein